MSSSLPKLVILRGLPGGGKSTFAKWLGYTYNHVEADDFFQKPSGYEFNQSLLEYAHMQCMADAAYHLSGNATDSSKVVVANTCLSTWEVTKYLRLANQVGLTNDDVYIVECNGGYKSVHNIPDEKFEHMKERWVTADEIKSQLATTPYSKYTNFLTKEQFISKFFN